MGAAESGEETAGGGVNKRQRKKRQKKFDNLLREALREMGRLSNYDWLGKTYVWKRVS